MTYARRIRAGGRGRSFFSGSRRPTPFLICVGIAATTVVAANLLLERGSLSFVSQARIDSALPAVVPSRIPLPAHDVPAEERAPAVEPALLEPGPFGPLPRIGPSGQRPFFAFASPFDLEDSRPKVAILIQGLGLQQAVTDAALDLPGDVALAFSPYGRNLERDVARARSAGHEVFVGLPMEPFSYPSNDPGPHTLTVEAPPGENLRRLHWILSRATSYIGLASDGGRFAGSDSVGPIISEVASRGLALVEVGTGGLTEDANRAGLPYARAAAPVDADLSPLSIDYALAGLEAEALENGSALGVLSALPVPMARLGDWIRGLPDKGLVLAPVSALLIEGAGLAAQLRGDGNAPAGPDHG